MFQENLHILMNLKNIFILIRLNRTYRMKDKENELKTSTLCLSLNKFYKIEIKIPLKLIIFRSYYHDNKIQFMKKKDTLLFNSTIAKYAYIITIMKKI